MPKVLVVDDTVMTRDILARLLRREGFITLTASSGHEAIHVIEEEPPDLVLLDINMPGIDGLDVLEQLHSHPQWKALPVIMMTAVSDTHAIHRAEQLGAKRFMVKATFSLGEMLHHVKSYTRYVTH